MSGQLLKSTAVVGGMTMISRILEFVRDMLIARIVDVDLATDAFFVAFKIPNFFRRLFAEGAFAYAFVTELSDYKENVYKPVNGWLLFFIRVSLASGAMSAGLYYFVDADWWNQWSSLERVINLAKWIGIGGAIYTATLMLTGLRLRHLSSPLR